MIISIRGRLGRRRNDRGWRTRTGRGCGGVKPDVEVQLPDLDVRVRDACFEFARRLVAGQFVEFAEYAVARTQTDYRLRGGEYPISDSLLAVFRAFVREQPALQINDGRFNQNLDYIRRRIRAEVVTAAYGVETSEQLLLESDEQLMRALEQIPKARQLRDQARLFPARSERQ
jgi:carboxyl-terminal processing protease